VSGRRTGRIWSADATLSHYRSILVRTQEDGSIEYLVGDSARSRDGWAALPANLESRVEWDARTIVLILHLSGDLDRWSNNSGGLVPIIGHGDAENAAAGGWTETVEVEAVDADAAIALVRAEAEACDCQLMSAEVRS
jgi:hypothetical protein